VSFRQHDNLIIKGFPCFRFETELQNVDCGFSGAGDFSGEPHLLLHVQQLLYLGI
jgi:hypothetical protein